MRPLVLGHRGFAAGELENSMAAFERAARTPGVDGVELDVQLSRHGEILVFHDADLGRLAGGTEHVDALSPLERKTIALAAPGPAPVGAPASSESGPGLHATGIPTLDEVLDVLPGAFTVDIELKSYGPGWRQLADAVAALLIRRGRTDHVAVSSFDPRAVRAFRRSCSRRGTRIPTAAIFAKHPEVPWFLRRGFGVTLSGSTIAKPEWHNLGVRRPRWVWTVNTREACERVYSAGVDAVIGDDPGALSAWLTEAAARSGAQGDDLPTETQPES